MTTPPSSNVLLQRAYDEPTPDDGYRVLVDRIWPRGRTKKQLRLDTWARDIGPSAELRKWFAHDPARWAAFQDRYRIELADPGRVQTLDALAERARHGHVTLVFGARDVEHNEARVIAAELEHRLGLRTQADEPSREQERSRAGADSNASTEQEVAELQVGTDT